MAKATSETTSPQNVLVIVESPTKASTIRKYLGDGFEVEASVGHVRDLVERKSDLSAKDKRREKSWVRYGINVENGFEPLEEIYKVPERSKRQVDTLKRQLKEADALYLATDDDREGEAISWHLVEELKPKVPVRRLVFREITKTAIRQSLESTRELNMDVVNAQRVRRVLDRLYGWDVSLLLWRKIKPGLSAGRVQSVALRLLVEREFERIQFATSEYWDAKASFSGPQGIDFRANLNRIAGQRVVSSNDFDAKTGIRKDNKSVLLTKDAVTSLIERLKNDTPRVASLEVKPLKKRPSAPFTTSTLQQEANRKLRMSAQRTMRIAQSLYEQGLITYMRTDSTRLSDEAVGAARETITDRFGASAMPSEPRVYVTKSAGAQEAHEAIRPSGTSFVSLEDAKSRLDEHGYRLYELIWRRTVASQMIDAQLEQTTVDIAIDDCNFRTSGSVVVVAGFLAVKSTNQGSSEQLPALEVGQVLKWGPAPTLEALEHHTRPPARLTDATLVRALEDKGIGRPSTYAAIVSKLIDLAYAFRRGNALVPSFVGIAVTSLLKKHMPHLVDYRFTAEMESKLDAIARGEEKAGVYLQGFYRDGFEDADTGHVQGLVPLLDAVRDQIDPAVASTIPIGERDGERLDVRVGRYGPFVKWGTRTASVPDEFAPDEMTMDAAITLIEAKEKGEAPLGVGPDGVEVFLRNGRYGWYLQHGRVVKGEDKPKMVSLSTGMKPEDITLDRAVAQLALPRDLGVHPDKKHPVLALVGRYGDYIKCGEETRSLPPGNFSVDIDLDFALTLLARPRANGREMLSEIGKRERDGALLSLWRGRWGPYVTDGTTNFNLGDIDPTTVDVPTATKLIDQARKDKEGVILGKHPRSGTEVRVLKGPWGYYCTDGSHNASLPKGVARDDVDLALAVQRLDSYGKPIKKKRGAKRKKTASVKTAAKKKPAKKKAAKKKATKTPSSEK
ncbi:MAG TPA: type I DNA topoisomerase, partial [Myxococcales bacterium]|nr:type I DNA topoisomerase [Myxococcales bacterium]